MNSFSIKKVQIIRNSIKRAPNGFYACKKLMEDKSCRLSMKFISVAKIKIIKGLKGTRSMSIDVLDNFCIKLAADVINLTLHHIIHYPLCNFDFLVLYPRIDMRNYRPYTILSPLSKILEKIV